ncbi:MAG TPA: twin-arginine translocase subunit TatC [Verrucomicrobiae bacterium]|jgi:sec-independent protein translocase protein TatC|nr:twin-arginine translocase subunit TatC [Verrucomicrobiae bacterium]
MAEFSSEPPEDGGGPVKSFLEHLEDFRWVLVKVSVSLGLAMLICLIGANYVMAVIKWPLTHAPASFPGTNQIVTVSFGANRLGHFQLSDAEQKSLNLGTNRFIAVTVEPLTLGTNQILGWHVDSNPVTANEAKQMQIDLVNLSPAGGFFVAIQVAFYGGLVLAAPFIFYFVIAFVFPALKMREQKYVFRALFIGGGLFLVGVCFCYFALMPVALAASQKYSNWLGLGASQWRAEDYISFVCRFMLGMGLGFEMPVVILTLVKIGVLSYSTLSKARRYMIVINLILGAVLTTPEVVTQILMFVPLQLLYEITVWIAWYWNRQEKKQITREI